MKILTAAQMREIDRLTSEKVGIPSLLLMENAGFQLYRALSRHFPDLDRKRIAILCGKGNNGGDGLVLARQLAQRGVFAHVFLLSEALAVAGDARLQLEACRGWEIPIQEVSTLEEWEKHRERIGDYDILVDALLGTGIAKPLEGLYAAAVEAVNRCRAFVLAVDIPSGMMSDALKGGATTVRANATVTFTAPKIAHCLNDDLEAVGRLHVAPIGTPARLLDRPDFWLELLTPEEVRKLLPPRPANSHKGTYGHVAIVAGSRGKAGAAGLCARAALRAGSGLVTACVPESVQPVVAAFQPEVMTEGLAATAEGSFSAAALDALRVHLQGKDAAALGPGMTTEPSTLELVHEIVADAPVPLILDADALNALARRPGTLEGRRGQALVLTPHPGEFSRLTGVSTPDVLPSRLELSRDFARRFQVWLVLKSFRTLVATPSGEVFVCPLGNPGMATAGMGDALTGIVTSLVGRFAAGGWTGVPDVTRAVLLAVFLHALAGDLAAETRGPEALTAGDVIECLGEAYARLARREE